MQNFLFQVRWQFTWAVVLVSVLAIAADLLFLASFQPSGIAPIAITLSVSLLIFLLTAYFCLSPRLLISQDGIVVRDTWLDVVHTALAWSQVESVVFARYWPGMRIVVKAGPQYQVLDPRMWRLVKSDSPLTEIPFRPFGWRMNMKASALAQALRHYHPGVQAGTARDVWAVRKAWLKWRLGRQ